MGTQLRIMRNLILLFLSVLALEGFAQITLTKDDFPVKGDTVPTASAVLKPKDLPVAVFYTGSPTFDLDLSKMAIVEKGVERFDDPEADGMLGGSDVPKADFGYSTPEGTLFFSADGNDLSVVGVGQEAQSVEIGFPFDEELEFMKAPLTYPYENRDTANASRTLLNIINIDVEVTSHYEVNGHGKLTIPGDTTFDVIRIRRQLNFKTTTKITFPPSTDEQLDSLVTWEFYADGIKSTVLRILGSYETDAGGNIIDTNIIFTFFDKGIPIGKKEIPSARRPEISLNANGLMVNGMEPTYNVEIVSLDGKVIMSRNNVASGLRIQKPEMEAGIYLVRVSDNSGHSTVKKFLF